MGNKYLSEVIEEHKNEIFGTDKSNNNLVLITAGVGASKNTWVQEYLTKELENSEKILFITSRKLIKEQILKDKNFSTNYLDCKVCNHNYVITHHSLKHFFQNAENFNKLLNMDFKYIVVDEVHSIISDASYTDTAYYLYSLINFYSAKDVKVICLSATTKDILPFFNYFENFKHFDFTNECKNVQPKNIKVVSKNTAFSILKEATSDNKMIYMANSVSDICNSYFPKIIKNYGVDVNSIGVIISEARCTNIKSNTTNPDLKVCLENMTNLTDYIVENEKLPTETNIVLASSRIKEGINIKDDNIKAMFCEAHNEIDILQFSGRYRGNVDTLYIINDVRSHYVKSDIDALEFEYNYLYSFGLLNANIYSSILLKKALDYNSVFLTENTCNFYSLALNYLPLDLANQRAKYFENKEKAHKSISEKELDNIYKEYYLKMYNTFKDYILNKHSILQYNLILNKYEIYVAKYFYIKYEYDSYIQYKNNPKKYLKELFKTDNVEIDASIFNTKEDIKLKNYEIIVEYLSNHNLFNVSLDKEQQFDILNEILPLLINSKEYSSLCIMLKAFGIKTKRVGKNEDGKRIILY